MKPGNNLIKEIKKIDIYSLIGWLDKRGINYDEATQLSFLDIAYNFIGRRIPSLKNVIGSVGSDVNRKQSTSTISGSVSHYTPNSIKSILVSMNLYTADQSFKFLDAGCGDCYFALVIQMCFPHASVSFAGFYLYMFVFRFNCCINLLIFSYLGYMCGFARSGSYRDDNPINLQLYSFQPN